MATSPRPQVSVVAGCLFEIALPPVAGGWRWEGAGNAAVTLLERAGEAGDHRFRFRAEAAAARAGEVVLRFSPEGGGDPAVVTVRVAPEVFTDG